MLLNFYPMEFERIHFHSFYQNLDYELQHNKRILSIIFVHKDSKEVRIVLAFEINQIVGNKRVELISSQNGGKVRHPFEMQADCIYKKTIELILFLY